MTQSGHSATHFKRASSTMSERIAFLDDFVSKHQSQQKLILSILAISCLLWFARIVARVASMADSPRASSVPTGMFPTANASAPNSRLNEQ